MRPAFYSLLSLCAFTASASAMHRLQPAPDGKKEVKPVVEPEVRTFLPDRPLSPVTVGALFSEHGFGAYFDSITGLWSPPKRDAFLFLDSRYHTEDTGQFISSTGLGFRKLLPDHEVIIGANVFWDRIHSDEGNDFNQLGLGLEVLTHWVDARFNYYLPDNDHYEIGRDSHRSTRRELTAFGVVEETEKTFTKRYESGLEGFNAEIGFLIPGLDRYIETRIFAGYYHYENPFGSDYEGFKARLEARLLPGVVADVEYWDDSALNGGHWTAGISASVPFSFYNLVTGRNPFEGIGEMYRPGPRQFSDRMSEMIERSHRIQTTKSGSIVTGRSHDERLLGTAAAGGGFGGFGFGVE